jgi:hypothetical protein
MSAAQTATEHRHSPPGQHEHEFEAAPGLPEPLPRGERLLWQGAPDWKRLALRTFHVRKVAIYFGVILALRAINVLADGGDVASALIAVAWLLPLVVFALGTLIALAWMTGRTAMYTITDRRVIMRIGIVLTLTFNLPLRRIASAGLRLDADGMGDIPLALAAGERIGWLHLWPHSRPWRWARAEPMLRSVADARHVAEILTQAWSVANGRVEPARAAQVSTARDVSVVPATQAASGAPLAAAH